MSRVAGVLIVVVVAACSFDGSMQAGDDVTTPGVWRLDTEADFHATGAWFTGAITTSPGAITVGRYSHGALAAAGRTSCGIGTGQHATIAWADVIAAPPVGRGYGVPTRPFTDGVVAGLGLAGDMFTAWWEGEVWLEAGTHTFHLVADDRAFLEVLRPDGWQRVAAEGDASGDVAVTFAAWYPVRIAFAECGGEQGLAIGHRAPGAADEVPLSEARLRAVVNGAGGLVISAFDDRANLMPVGMAAAAGPLVAADWAGGRPADLGLTADDTYTIRWAGQLRIDLAGDYAFHVSSDNGHRLRIDGTDVLDYMVFDPYIAIQTSPPVTLAAGWHDVALDFQEDTGLSAVALTVDSGPELVGLPIPADRLRPMPGPATRMVARTIARDTPIPDLQTTTVPMRVEAPPGAVVDRVNFGYFLEHPRTDDLVISLVSPAGTRVTVRNRVYVGTTLVDRWNMTEFAGEDPSGVWSLDVVDAAGADVGTIHLFSLTVHYRGGDPAQPAVATWESDVHPLGSVRSIERLQWVTGPSTAPVELAIRTCPAADQCTGPYVVVPGSGDMPAVTAAPFAQLRATLTPAGDDLPSIDSIELDYTP